MMKLNKQTKCNRLPRRTATHPLRRKLAAELLERRYLLAASGPALALDGVDDYATAADHASLDLGIGGSEDFTIEASIYVPDTNITGNKTLFYKQNAYALFFNQNGEAT